MAKKSVSKDVIVLALQNAIRNCEDRLEKAKLEDKSKQGGNLPACLSLIGKLDGLMEALNIVRGI